MSAEGVTSPSRAHVNRGLTIARRLARSWAPRSRALDYEELCAEASLALSEALPKFDPARGVPFEGYVWTAIDFALRKRIAAADRWRRKPVRGGAGAFTEADSEERKDFFEGSRANVLQTIEAGIADYAMALRLDLTGAAPVASPEEQLCEGEEADAARDALKASLSLLAPVDLELLRLLHEEEQPYRIVAKGRAESLSSAHRRHRALLQQLRRDLKTRGVVGARRLADGRGSLFAQVLSPPAAQSK